LTRDILRRWERLVCFAKPSYQFILLVGWQALPRAESSKEPPTLKAVSDLFRRGRQMPVDDINDLKLFGQIEQGSHRAMAITSDPLGEPSSGVSAGLQPVPDKPK